MTRLRRRAPIDRRQPDPTPDARTALRIAADRMRARAAALLAGDHETASRLRAEAEAELVARGVWISGYGWSR